MSGAGADLLTAGTPRLKAPPGICDTQMHFYGPREKYKLAPTSPFEPPLATVPIYRELMRRLGIERVIVVQAASYDWDNRCVLDSIAELGRERARGIAVVPPDIEPAELRRLTEAGIRGARFFMLRGTVLSWDMLEPLAARIADHGWHIQLQFDGRELPQYEERLKRLPCPFVIDHNGKYLEPVRPDHPSFQALLRLLDTGRCWVKASAPYETSKLGPPLYADVGALAKAIIRRAPERVLWASNWPHPSAPDAKPDDALLLDLLLDWGPDDATRRRILVDNPAALYGF